MTVPVLTEFIAIVFNFIEEKCVEEPEVVRVTAIKRVEPF